MLLPLASPALPLDEAGRYVAGAYVVFVVLLVVYVAIMAAKLQRIDRELQEVADLAERKQASEGSGPGPDTHSVSDSLAAPGSRGTGA